MNADPSIRLRTARLILANSNAVQSRAAVRSQLPTGAIERSTLHRTMRRKLSGTDGGGSRNNVTLAFQKALKDLETAGYLTRAEAIITVIDRSGLAQFSTDQEVKEESWSR